MSADRLGEFKGLELASVVETSLRGYNEDKAWNPSIAVPKIL